ncbi:MAG TPA: hypothetical protein VIC54_01570 [Terriglobales bacterium]|jgi:phenylacetate-CoA ligase
MSLAHQFYGRLVYPLLDADQRGLSRRLRQLRAWETLSPEAARQRQWQALRSLLRHAYNTCPFYRARFDMAGVHPDAIQEPQDMERIPPLTRQDLRAHGLEMQSRTVPAATLRPAASGGTTDLPVPLWRDPETIRARYAVQIAMRAWAGWRPGDKSFLLWGARSDFPAQPSWRWRLFQRHVLREVFAPGSLLNQEIMEQFRLRLNAFRPQAIVAYPSALALWSEFLLHSGRNYFRPPSLLVTAEALLPQQRQVIELAFDRPVFEHYGSREFGIIASQCEAQTGMHLHPAAAWLDTPLVAGAGGLREMLVTDLIGYGFPLIRYRINDCVQGEPATGCACGRPFPLLPPLVGRSADIFYLPDGTAIPGVTFTGRILKVCPQILQMQLIQETPREFRFRYVAGPDFAAGGLQAIEAGIAAFFPPGLHWTLEAVAEIPREANGKTRFAISKVPAGASPAARSTPPSGA